MAKNKEVKKPAPKLNKDFLINQYPGTKISVFFQTIVYTLIMIAIFGTTGYYLDAKYDSSPKFTIIAVAVSWPVTQILLYKIFRRYAQNKINKG